MVTVELDTPQETRLFIDLCETLGLRSPQARGLFKELVGVGGSLNALFKKVVTLVNSGPIELLSAEELKYLSILELKRSQHLPSDDNDETIYSAASKVLNERFVGEAEVNAAYRDVQLYVAAIESLFKNFKEYARASFQRELNLPDGDDEISIMAQKLRALSLRKQALEQQVHSLAHKNSSRLKQHFNITRVEAHVADQHPRFYAENYKRAAVLQVFGVAFPSYDRLLGKLKELQWELHYDNSENASILEKARRQASQVVLSIVNKCWTTLDTIFMEASRTYNRSAPELPEYAAAINDERAAVMAEISSLWDETVPLAHMYVEAEYLKPILDKTGLSEANHYAQDAAISSYTSAMLRVMNNHLCILADRIKLLVYHHQTMFNALTLLDAMRDKTTLDNVQLDKLATTAAHKFKSKEIDNGREFTLLEFIQRQMELYGSIPIDVGQKSRSLSSRAKKVTKLEEFVSQRHRNGQYLARDIHRFFEAAVKSDLTDAELSGQLLLDCVIADSSNGLKKWDDLFRDAEVEALITTLREDASVVYRNVRAHTTTPMPDFVAWTCTRLAREMTTKHGSGSGCYRNDDDEVSCTTCRRCVKFFDILRRWGDEGDHIA
ncbi:hypothetical protein F4779DRAFT_613280 [Xylariaceae sp. FL0662B]|nr:hypothetical protein F4779DRAFT_613280 [Xylariaceae sp. FL0662B]